MLMAVISCIQWYCLCTLPLLGLYEVPNLTAVMNGMEYLRNQTHVLVYNGIWAKTEYLYQCMHCGSFQTAVIEIFL